MPRRAVDANGMAPGPPVNGDGDPVRGLVIALIGALLLWAALAAAYFAYRAWRG